MNLLILITLFRVPTIKIETYAKSKISNRTKPDYLRTLPIHESQRELVELKEDEASYFELTVRPTFDLYQSLLAQADQIEVLEPASVRNEMRNFAKNLMSYYKEERQ